MPQITPINAKTNTLCSDVEIKGSLVFKGELIFDGKLTSGSIQGESLVLGENADIQANIKTDFLTIQGKVIGNVDVTETAILGATAFLQGDLKTSRLAMQDGATFVGKSAVGPREGKARGPG